LTTMPRHVAVRPFIVLLAALVLASSAIVAMSAEAQAAKPIPSVSYIDGSATCTLLAGPAVVMGADFDLSANKGRWVYVQVEVRIVGLTPWTVLVEAGTRMDRRQSLLMSTSFPGSGYGDGAFRVTMTDRKGNPMGGPKTEATSQAVDCP